MIKYGMSRIPLLYIGLVILAIGYIGMALFPYPHGDWTTFFYSLPQIGIICIALALLVRLFTPSQSISTSNTTAVNTTDTDKDFTYWRNALLAGFVLWLPVFISSVSLAFATDGRGFLDHLPYYASLFALPMSIICLVVAYKIRSTNLSRATFILKIPFYYAAGMIVVLFGSSWLGL